MKVLLVFLVLTTSAMGQQGIDPNIGTGTLPEGLAGVTDLNELKRLRLSALEKRVEGLTARYQAGLDSIELLLGAQAEVCAARLDAASNQQEQLRVVKQAFNSSLLLWQRTKKLQEVGAGGSGAEEASARAQVFRYRVLWLKVKSGEEIGLTLFSTP